MENNVRVAKNMNRGAAKGLAAQAGGRGPAPAWSNVNSQHGNGTTSGNNNDGWFGQQGRTWNVDANLGIKNADAPSGIKNVDAPSGIDMENTEILK